MAQTVSEKLKASRAAKDRVARGQVQTAGPPGAAKSPAAQRAARIAASGKTLSKTRQQVAREAVAAREASGQGVTAALRRFAATGSTEPPSARKAKGRPSGRGGVRQRR